MKIRVRPSLFARVQKVEDSILYNRESFDARLSKENVDKALILTKKYKELEDAYYSIWNEALDAISRIDDLSIIIDAATKAQKDMHTTQTRQMSIIEEITQLLQSEFI